MNKLGALDANFLYTETDKMVNHVASVQVMQLPDGTDPAHFVEGLKTYTEARLHLVPYLHRKLKFVPGNFDHPVWITDHSIDIANHIYTEAIDAPGGREEMDRKIAEIHSRRMDLTRPLWNLVVLTGLPDNQVAYYQQTHHAAIDGVSGQTAIMTMMDTTPLHPAVPAAVVDAMPDDSMAQMFEQTFMNLLNYQIDTTQRLFGTMDASTRLFQRMINPSLGLGAMANAPVKTRFNQAIGERKAFSSAEMSLAELKQIGKPFGCTLNDVFLAVCGGGLRRYLARRDELPAQTLTAGCPVSLRRPEDTGFGNKVTMMCVELATDETAPLTRLLRIKQSAQVAKGVTADMANGYFPEVSLPLLPAMMSSMTALAEMAGAGNAMQAPYNVVISNVPGPRETLYSNGAEMLTHYPVSIAAHGLGLNITVQSYKDTMYVGITACEDALPDAAQLRDDLLFAFNELRQTLNPASILPIRGSKSVPVVAGAEQTATAASEDLPSKVA